MRGAARLHAQSAATRRSAQCAHGRLSCEDPLASDLADDVTYLQGAVELGRRAGHDLRNLRHATRRVEDQADLVPTCQLEAGEHAPRASRPACQQGVVVVVARPARLDRLVDSSAAEQGFVQLVGR